ncbi:hypothetical protein BDV30DRAFT_222681 [Aspergillus minisclerotigenes]|uniref:Replication factor C subunit 1 n=1 Tax=Aspergillus minisclerotigenes TaxID=656917 RepID=A0A5N6JHY7_9EURO|nr:hypothetical protein BDV30DRAFT_222681 [Aspergillus minisclerotigenes]
MPADIRSFFGGKPSSSQGSSASPAKPPAKKEEPAGRKRRGRKVVDDSEDEDDVKATKAPPPKAKELTKPKPEEPQGEVTTTSDYFASSKKRGRPAKTSTATPIKEPQPPNDTISEEGKASKSPRANKQTEKKEAPERPTRESKRKATTVLDDERLGGDDIFATEFGKPGKGDDDYVEDEHSEKDSDLEELAVKPATAASSRPGRKKPASKLAPDDDDVVMEDAPKQPKRATKSAASQPGRKRKSEALGKEEDDEPQESPKKGTSHSKASSTARAPKKPKGSPSKKDQPESKEIQSIFDSIPTVRPPSPPPESGDKKKFNPFAARARSPAAAGTAEIPVGAENCLAGLSFVFTGVLDTLGREEGQNLVKKYGGKVTGAPSSKTSYVVLGGDAGPKKLKTIRDHNLKTINEEGLFELIRRLPANGGDGKAAEKYEEKRKAEDKKIRAMAAEIEQEEKRKAKATSTAATKASAGSQAPSNSQGPTPEDELWTTKYAPTSMNMICGNKTAVEKLQSWLRDWHKNAKGNFSKPGKDGTGIYRAVMIHGPPGIGKTTAAHLVAKLEGYDIVETNASDTRSKKLVETGLLGVLDTTSLQGYFAADGQKVHREKKNMVLIMDEVDGMSAGDRGGVGALAAIAKKTHIPLILICNERRLPKMKPFDHVTYELPFRRPTAEQIRARLSTICFREGLKIPPPVLDSLIEGTHADIRQIINMLSTVKLDQKNLNFEKGREMSKAWEKHVILKPWDIVSKILSAQMFSPSSKATLNDKIELYFNDHEFSYLMLQENYLRTRPALSGNYQGKEQKLKLLELADNAASSISDGDLVDRMIHGTQQQWSLMPTHAVFSFVRPASFAYGNMTERAGFTSWLGQNSKQGKLWRCTKEIQGHMRLRASGDRDEIRQQYLPLIWDKLVRRLMKDGKEGVEDVIDFMDSYFLTRDDWDALVELGLGPMDQSMVKLDTQTKATFTRLYNQRSHPLPFMKASSVAAPKKMPKEKPDIEDAIDESDDEVLEDDTKEDDESEELDLKKDKYVRVPKKPAAKSAAKGGSGKGKKAKKAADDDFIDDDEKPKKGRGRKAKAYFTIWQLRTSYLSTIKDGIGDRLINVNNSVLNTPGFRAAGWSSASTNPSAQSVAAHIRRTYSPPIPTTAAVTSEYYQLGVSRDANEAQRFGLGEDGEEDEGGMVTGKSSTEVIGRRPHGRAGKRTHRKERQQNDSYKQRDAEEDDSSDLSDESDDDVDSQRASQQIKFPKLPIRTRAGSSPIRSTDRQEGPQLMVTSPSHPTMGMHYRTGSLGTAVSVNERPRRDTTTTASSDMSSDNEMGSLASRKQIQFSGQDQVIELASNRRRGAGNRNLGGLDEHPEDSGAESEDSALSSDFDATAGSASLLVGVGITGSLDSSSPMMMHKLPNGTGPQTASPRKAKTPAPELQDLPPPRPISTVQPVSLLSKALNARKRAPTNPVEKFAVLSGKGLTDALNIKLYLPFSSDPEEPIDLPIARESKLAEQPAPVTVVEAIGLALWRYSEEGRQPAIERNKLTVNRWALRMVEDGEVEYDFPALGRTSQISDFTSNNNRATGARGRGRGKQYDEFALVEASDSEFEENERQFPMESQAVLPEDTNDAASALNVPSAQPTSQNKAPRPNPILGQPFSSALNDNTLTPADRPAVPTSHATPRLGVSKTLKIRFINIEGSTQVTTLNTSTDSYIAEILDSVCKRWGLDKGNYLLKVMGSNTIAPLDRTVEALGNLTELDLVRRRFGPQSLTGSPGSSSPNAPLQIDSGTVPSSKKAKKGGPRMLHPLAQQQDLIGGYYRRYHVFRKQSMSFTASNHKILTFDNDYMHIMPGDTAKTGSDTKTRSISFNDVVGCKVSRRHPKNFRVVVLRGNDANEQKRYDFEARNALEAVEIVDEIKKNMAHYRI